MQWGSKLSILRGAKNFLNKYNFYRGRDTLSPLPHLHPPPPPQALPSSKVKCDALNVKCFNVKPENEVSSFVGFPRFDQRVVTSDCLFQDVMAAVKLLGG